MNPNQPATNYDFILNPPSAKRRLGLPGSSNPFFMRIALIIGVGVVLVIVLALIGSLLGGGGIDTKTLSGIAETQNELVRVSKQANSYLTQSATQNLSINVDLTVLTQQQQLIAFLKTHGTKLSPKQLALKKNATTDTQLTNAQQNSTYDVVFAQLIGNQLNSYASDLRQAYKATTSKSVRALLSADYTQTQMLIKQIPSASSLQT